MDKLPETAAVTVGLKCGTVQTVTINTQQPIMHQLNELFGNTWLCFNFSFCNLKIAGLLRSGGVS